MKTYICIFWLFFFPLIALCQNEQPKAIAETMASTFNLYGDKSAGTCFMISKGEKQYFITAAHLFQPSHQSGDLVSIQMVVQNLAQTFDVHVYFHANRKVDIAVFTLPEKIVQDLNVPEEHAKYKEVLQQWYAGKGVSTDSIFVAEGMDVYFLGFPLGMGTEFLGIKFPLVKKAVISGWVKHDGIDKLLLDGHNNLGFSGGPITIFNSVSKKMCLVGVVSGYLPEPIDIKNNKEQLTVNANSGIIICYEKRLIDELFASNKKYL